MTNSRIYILPFVLASVSAGAVELSIYYDINPDTSCETFCNFPYKGDGCCPAANVVTPEAIYEKFAASAEGLDKTFSGFKLPDGTELMDSSGELKLTGNQVASKGSSVSGATLRATNRCQTGTKQNQKGICVSASALDTPENENIAYIDWSLLTPTYNGNGVPSDFGGGEIPASEVGEHGEKGCQYYRKFKVKFHWCPESYETFTWRWANTGSVPQGWTAKEAPEKWPSNCNAQSSPTYDYYWNSKAGLTPGAATYKLNGVTQTRIDVPSSFDYNWQLRGFYLLNYPQQPSSGCAAGDHNTLGNDLPSGCIQYWGYRNTVAQNLVTTETSTWGTARLGLKKGTESDLTYIPVDDNELNNWANTRWAIWSCTPIQETDVIHLYAGWGYKPTVGENVEGRFKIYRTGLQNPNKGDAEYNYWCNNGATVHGGNTYNPVCELGGCSKTNPAGCTTLELCLNAGETHWCYNNSSEPECLYGASGRNTCCNDNLTACTKESACDAVGGQWVDGTCTSGGN